MLLKYKILIGVVVVGVLVAIGVTLGVVLSNDDEDATLLEDICETSRIYRKNRRFMEEIPNPHFLKTTKHGPPDVPIKNRATRPRWAWLTQRLDHFNPVEQRTWEMRYLYNDEFYEDGGPMFIFLGGEWEISEGYMMAGQTYEMAKSHSGYLFYIEHRYYGKSIPTENLCTENLLYLNIDQALADVVYFIEYQRNRIPSLRESKVVVVGGSYSATMATWFRVKYPHVVDAALSSSAPLLAIEDFYRKVQKLPQYYEVVGDNMRLASEECVRTIDEALEEVQKALETEKGVDRMSSDFGTCSRINTKEPHLSYFFSSLISPFAGLVQYASGDDIKEVCDEISANPGSSYEKFRAFTRKRYEGFCIGDYDYLVTYLDYPLVNGISRQWYYQTCVEYGFYQTTASDKIPFGKYMVKVDLYRNICEDVFGVTPQMLNDGIERTNLLNGALNPSVTKVVSVHGTVDPWHSIGALEDINKEAPVFVIEGTSHCVDLLSDSDSDLTAMRDIRIKVRELIASWIKD